VTAEMCKQVGLAASPSFGVSVLPLGAFAPCSLFLQAIPPALL
jgi:hypothetical protein